MFGDSLVAIRVLPALAGAATVFLAGVVAWQLKGGRFAQGLAALAILLSPVFLGTAHYYSMNVWDQLFWVAAVSMLVAALDSPQPQRWLLLGVVLGLALLNKISVLWLGGGIGVALLLTPYRRVLRQPGPWLAAAVAALVASPYLAWQIANGWPTLEFMRNATELKMADISPGRFALDQILSMNPGTAPIWIAGLVLSLSGREGDTGRVIGWVYLSVFLLLAVAGSSRASYLAPIYPPLVALGAVSIERLSTPGRRQWLRPVGAGLVVASGVAITPFALPLLPVDTFVRYQAALGVEPRTEERQQLGALPQQYADMFGWDEMTELVAEAYNRLTPEERLRCRIFAQNYGEAGAIDVLGRRLGLPSAVSGHNSYWMWGPGTGSWDVVIIIGGDREDNAAVFESVEIVGQTASSWSMPYERGLDVTIARGLKVDVRELWPQLKQFI